MSGVAIIGAGSAGLAAAQALAARGIELTIYEAGSGVGGNWRYDNDSGLSSGYASLRANTSRRNTAFRCFPVPADAGLFLHHAEMLDYLERFTDHFGLRSRIRFGTTVSRARPVAGGWEVEAAGRRQRFRALVVATGFNSLPRWPEIPGDFSGVRVHAHEYRTPDRFAGKRVVVVGLGCSAAELAAEISGVAASVTIAPRSGAWITPRRLGPIPVDWFDSRAASRLPFTIRRAILARLLRLAAGSLAGTGLPAPDYPLGARPITVTDHLLERLREGRISAAPAVVALHGEWVEFADGTQQVADILLLGTGYETRFDFLEANDAPTSESARLYRGIASIEHEGLFFVGFAMAHGALMPVMEAQAGWVAAVVSGEIRLPDRDRMRLAAAADAAERARYFDPRFALLVDRLPYCRRLEAEVASARRRSRASLPTAASAGAVLSGLRRR